MILAVMRQIVTSVVPFLTLANYGGSRFASSMLGGRQRRARAGAGARGGGGVAGADNGGEGRGCVPVRLFCARFHGAPGGGEQLSVREGRTHCPIAAPSPGLARGFRFWPAFPRR